MISDEFFLDGNNIHEWLPMIATILNVKTEEVVYELQAATWEDLRQYSFDDISSPAYVFMKHLLAMATKAIRDITGDSLDIDTANNGRASGIAIEGQEVYSYRDFSRLLRRLSNYDELRDILLALTRSSCFDDSELLAELKDSGSRVVGIRYKMNPAMLEALELDGLPTTDLALPIGEAIGISNYLKKFIIENMADEFCGSEVVIENEGVAILISVSTGNGYVPITTFKDLLRVTKHNACA